MKSAQSWIADRHLLEKIRWKMCHWAFDYANDDDKKDKFVRQKVLFRACCTDF